MTSLDAMQEHAAAEKRLSIHLAGWRECDLGNERCEHVQRRNAAYLAYTKKPHPSVRSVSIRGQKWLEDHPDTTGGTKKENV